MCSGCFWCFWISHLYAPPLLPSSCDSRVWDDSRDEGEARLPGNEKWCWCQRWNRPNHPWAELHNSNIILLHPPPPLLSVITALSSGTLSLADSRFRQIWFLFLYVPVTSLLLREPCAGIGTRIKSASIAKHDGKDGEGERPKHAYTICEEDVIWMRIFLFLLFHPCLYFVFCFVFFYFAVSQL